MITHPLHMLRCNDTGHDACVNQGAGHEIRPMQARLTAAAPGQWSDGIVVRATTDGWIGIAMLGPADEADPSDALPYDALPTTLWVWNHADHSAQLTNGQPVAVHPLHNVLAHGSSRISIVTI